MELLWRFVSRVSDFSLSDVKCFLCLSMDVYTGNQANLILPKLSSKELMVFTTAESASALAKSPSVPVKKEALIMLYFTTIGSF